MLVCFPLIRVCHTLLPTSEFKRLRQDRQLVMVDADLSQLAIFQSQIDVFIKKKKENKEKNVHLKMSQTLLISVPDSH